MKTDTCSSSRRAAHKHVKMTDTLLFSDLCRIRQKNASKSTLDILHSLTVIMGELYGNDIPVKNITQTFCRRLLRFMESRKLAPGTIRTYLAAMQSLLRMVNGFRVPDIARLMPRRQQSVKEATLQYLLFDYPGGDLYKLLKRGEFFTVIDTNK